MEAYVVRIDFMGAKPPIWRRVIIPEGTSFEQLHYIIQKISNFISYPEWGDYHLYKFNLKKDEILITASEEIYQDYLDRIEHAQTKEKKLEQTKALLQGFSKDDLKLFTEDYFSYFLEDSGQERKEELEEKYGPGWKALFGIEDNEIIANREREVFLAKDTLIDKFLKENNYINYMYDFGDGWKLKIKLEKIISDYDKTYATLVKGRLNAPPEDVGSMYGYYDFLEKYNDPQHPEHEQIYQWAQDQGYREFDLEEINQELREFTYKDKDWYQNLIKN